MTQPKRNVFLNVDSTQPPAPEVKEEEVIDLPNPAESAPPEVEPITEDKIFKKDLVLKKPDDKPKGKYARKTNQKREVTPKMQAHLDRIRVKANETKAKNKAEREAKKAQSQAQPQVVQPPITEVPPQPVEIPSKPIDIPQPPRSDSIDYDKIINGLWYKQQQHNKQQQEMEDWKIKIRKEEREKALKESTQLFKEAATTYQNRQKQHAGMQVLQGYRPKHHPVFNRQQNTKKYERPQGAPVNPYDACFQ